MKYKLIIKRFFVYSLLVCVVIGGTAWWLWGKYTVPVLMYHNIEETEVLRTDTTSPVILERQLKYMRDRGFYIIRLEELVEGIKAGRKFPRKSVVLTFDDGEVNNIENAVPILKKYQAPAIFFISPGFTKDEGYLNWEQLKQMKADGFDIGSHGMMHGYLPDLSPEERAGELEESKRLLEEYLGGAVDFFAYPLGGFNEEVKGEVRSAGYKAALTTNRGHDRFNRRIYELNRIRVCDKDNKDYILFFKLCGYYNLLRKSKQPD